MEILLRYTEIKLVQELETSMLISKLDITHTSRKVSSFYSMINNYGLC
jgi:hypothetical protein